MPYHIYHIFVFSASQCHSEFSITGNGKTWIKRNPKLRKTCVVCLFIFLSTWFVRFEKTLWCECSKSILFLWFIICIISYQLSNREFEIKVNSLNNKTHSHPKSPRQYKMRWLERHRTVCWGSTSSHFERSSKISGLAVISNNTFSNDFHHMQRCWFCNLINL